MQAIKDAGIVLVVILLLVSVRFSPLDETSEATGTVSLTPQTEAARIDLSAPTVSVNAGILSTPERQVSIVKWVMSDSKEIVHEVDIDGTEHCAQRVFHLHRANEKSQDGVFVFEAEEVVKVLPCST